MLCVDELRMGAMEHQSSLLNPDDERVKKSKRDRDELKSRPHHDVEIVDADAALTAAEELSCRMAALRAITRLIDSNKSWLVVSVSTYGCVELSSMATDSARPLALQPLPPIFPIIDQTHGLPNNSVLHLFDENVRTTLPYDNRSLSCMANISKLLLETAGHPRRVEIALHELNGETGLRPLLEGVKSNLLPRRKDALHAYGNLLDTSLAAQAREGMDSRFQWDAKHATPNILPLAFNNFKFPESKTTSPMEEIFLQGSTNGMCSFVPSVSGGETTKHGRAFIPYPVMRMIAEKQGAQTLTFVKAIDEYFVVGDDNAASNGKRFEHIVQAMVALIAEKQEKFSLQSLCRKFDAKSPAFSTTLSSGPITVRSNVDVFPSKLENDKVTVTSYQDFDALIGNGNAGTVLLPTHQYNLGWDVIAVLRVQEPLVLPDRDNVRFIVAFIQVKDIFDSQVWRSKKEYELKYMMAWGKQFVEHKQVRPTHNGFQNTIGSYVVDNSFPNVMRDNQALPAFIVATPGMHRDANEWQAGASEGILDMMHMRNTFPTIGYNVLAAHRLRQLWPQSSS